MKFSCFWGLVPCAQVHQSQRGRLWPGSHREEAYQGWGFWSGRRFASCLRGGGRGKFSTAGHSREQVVVQSLERRPGPGSRRSGEGAVAPSTHPEVPDTHFLSPARGVDIRQSMGWTKVCSTARSGIWVLKGDRMGRMLPANLDHLRVEWRKHGSYETAWVTPGHDCLCSCRKGHGAASQTTKYDSIWDAVIGLWCRVAPLLLPWCVRGDVPTGVNLNQYASPGSGTS